MTIARTIYMTSAIALASVLAVTIFSTGCGEDDTQSNDSTRSSSATINTQKNNSNDEESEKASAKLGPDDMSVELPGELQLVLVKVKAGAFEMSAFDRENEDNEVPHQATLTRDFYIGQTEVTQLQWRSIMGNKNNPSRFKGDDVPVQHVSWNDAMEFCEKLNGMEKAPKGWKFTLPTETQWEYAARGGDKSKGYKYSGSNNLDDVVAFYAEDAFEREEGSPMPVGQKKPNELGLYDMSGNVSEWCLDDYIDDSSKLKAEFTRGNDKDQKERVLRGGGCYSDLKYFRSKSRDKDDSDSGGMTIGFRVALVPVSY